MVADAVQQQCCRGFVKCCFVFVKYCRVWQMPCFDLQGHRTLEHTAENHDQIPSEVIVSVHWCHFGQ